MQQLSLKNQLDEARIRAQIMGALALAIEAKEAKDERAEAILEQEAIYKRLHPEKTQKPDLSPKITVHAYAESANALNEDLEAKERLLEHFHSSWDELDTSVETLRIRDAFFDELLLDVNRLFTLSPEEEAHLIHIKDTGLRDELEAIRKLPLEQQATAKESLHRLKPRLEKARKASSQQEQDRHEKMRSDLIHKTATLHRDIRALTQQVLMLQKFLHQLDANLAKKHLVASTMDPNHNSPRALTRSYQLLDRGLEAASNTNQRAPALNVIREDFESLKHLGSTSDLSVNAPQLAPYQHALEQGTLRTSSPSRNEITFRSLMQKAPTLAATVGESATAKLALQEEQKHTPSLKNNPEPELAPEAEKRFHPSPFSTRPSWGG